MNDASANLTNHFLIAMPQLEDPNFYQTATYICEHTAEGAMGLIINRPMNIQLADVLEQMEISATDPACQQIPVYYGGPVQVERGFILHSPATQWESTVTVTDNLAITTSRDILIDIAEGKGPKQYLITLGYAGWGAGQLEFELGQNTWLSGPADPAILFDVAVEDRWMRAAQDLGVDLNLLSGDSGHA